jgi:hypothetical protein
MLSPVKSTPLGDEKVVEVSTNADHLRVCPYRIPKEKKMAVENRRSLFINIIFSNPQFTKNKFLNSIVL